MSYNERWWLTRHSLYCNKLVTAVWNHELWQWDTKSTLYWPLVIVSYDHHYWALHLPSLVLVPSSSQASSEVTVAPPCVLATSSSSELWRQNVNICVLYPIMNGRVVTVVTMPPWKLWIYTSMVEIQQLGSGGNTSNEVCRLIAGLLHLPPPARCCCWCNVRILFCNVQIFCWDPDTPDKPHASRPVDFPWWSWIEFSYKILFHYILFI